jgi:vanillate O-demethylase ferredoxin subunit
MERDMGEPIEWGPARLNAVRDLTPDIRLFEIDPSGEFVSPTPGSHINVAVQIGDRPDVRSYSIVGPCSDGRYRIAVKLLPDTRGGSKYMWSLAPGSQMSISKPGNHFELGRGRPEYVLLAGGIGITPIYTMSLALAEAQANFRLLYACRSRQDVAFGPELSERLGDRLQVFLDEEGRRVDIAAEIARLVPGGELYVCGPIGMLEAARRAWQRSGRPVDGLRFETFGNSGRFASEAFVVKIPRLGIVVEVAQNQTMLDALEEAGVDMIFDCRRGECGLCALDILETEGTVDHRDVFFSDEEKAAGSKLCTCVSRVVGGSITVDTPDRPPAGPRA